MDLEKVLSEFKKKLKIEEYLPCPGAVGSTSLLFVIFILACGIQRTQSCGMSNISDKKNHHIHELWTVL